MKIFNRFTGDLILEVEGANLEYANLRYANLRDANLERANLRDANLRDANLERANLRYANLRDANLVRANLIGANLQYANLECANLIGANLECANLRYANLRGANLVRANLECANLERANLRDANLWGCAGDRDCIRSIFISEVYPITYTSEVIQIGCENHTIKDWFEFDDKRILQMDGKTALKFWREHKELIKQIVEKCPAKPTKYEEIKQCQ